MKESDAKNRLECIRTTLDAYEADFMRESAAAYAFRCRLEEAVELIECLLAEPIEREEGV